MFSVTYDLLSQSYTTSVFLPVNVLSAGHEFCAPTLTSSLWETSSPHFHPKRSLPHETQPAQSEFSILPLLLPTVTKSELNSGPQPSQDFSEIVEAFSGSWVSPAEEQKPGWEPHLQYKARKDATSQVGIQALLMRA